MTDIVRFDGDTGRLRIYGEMTIYQAAALKESIIASTSGKQVVELDLTDVTELDTAGLQLILSLQAANAKMVLVGGAGGSVQSVIDLLGLPPLSISPDRARL